MAAGAAYSRSRSPCPSLDRAAVLADPNVHSTGSLASKECRHHAQAHVGRPFVGSMISYHKSRAQERLFLAAGRHVGWMHEAGIACCFVRTPNSMKTTRMFPPKKMMCNLL